MAFWFASSPGLLGAWLSAVTPLPEAPTRGHRFHSILWCIWQRGEAWNFTHTRIQQAGNQNNLSHFHPLISHLRVKPNAKNNGYNLIQKPCHKPVLYISALRTLWTYKRLTNYQIRGVCHHSYWQREQGCWVWVCRDLQDPHTHTHTLYNTAVQFVVKSLWLKTQWNQN